MKKQTTKPAAKTPASTKPAAKKPAAKKPSSSTPKRKAQSQSELAQVVARLDAIMDKLNELLERVVQLTAPHANPTIQPMHRSTDEHADDVEVVGEGEEE
jgi:Zn-dependent oligopeptidase